MADALRCAVASMVKNAGWSLSFVLKYSPVEKALGEAVTHGVISVVAELCPPKIVLAKRDGRLFLLRGGCHERPLRGGDA